MLASLVLCTCWTRRLQYSLSSDILVFKASVFSVNSKNEKKKKSNVEFSVSIAQYVILYSCWDIITQSNSMNTAVFQNIFYRFKKMSQIDWLKITLVTGKYVSLFAAIGRISMLVGLQHRKKKTTKTTGRQHLTSMDLINKTKSLHTVFFLVCFSLSSKQVANNYTELKDWDCTFWAENTGGKKHLLSSTKLNVYLWVVEWLRLEEIS